MDHHGGVDVVEHPRFEHDDLAAAALLRRRAHDHQRACDLVHQRRQREARARTHGGDDVVTARVPEARERVVLAQDGHRRPARPAASDGPEGRGQVGDPALHLEATGCEFVGQPTAGLDLLEADLGVGVDAVAELQQRRRLALEVRVDALLDGCQV